MSDEQTPVEETEAPKKKRLRIEPFPVLGTKPESENEPEPSSEHLEHSLADEAEDVGPAIDQDALAAAASPPKSMPGTSASESPKLTTPPVSTAQPLGIPRKPNTRLRRHTDDDDSPHGPLELRDGLPPPTAVVVPYGRGIKADPTPVPRHRPASYEPAPVQPLLQPQAGTVADMRNVPPRLEAPLPAHAKKDSNVASIYEALAHLGPGETVVDVVVEVFDETMNQFWQIGQASSQPLTVIREPGRYLKWGGFYRVSVCPTGEGFSDKKTRSFTARIIGPPRPPNWRFDESDIGSNVYGAERGEFPMGFIPQQMMPQAPAPDPAETVVRSARALKELEQLWKKPDKDDDERRRVDELEAELRVARQGGGAWGGPPPWAMGGGWGGMPRRNEDEERRRREDEDRRRAEEERRRAEEERRRTEEEHRREEERRRVEEERRREDERRRIEDERRHAEELRRVEEQRHAEDERKRELAEVRAQFERQMQELTRSREEDKRRWDEERAARLDAERKAHEGLQSLQAQREREEERRRYEDARRDDKEKWEADRRRADEQFAEMRRQNELLAQKLERPQESTVDKLLGNLPQLMLQWQNMSASTRAEQLEAQRAAREDARAERDRAREDGTRQMQMWQEMSKMNVESLRAQSDQSQQYSRNLLEILGKNGSSDILNSVAGAMNMAVQAQTNALSAIAKSGLGGGGGPSPWVDVAAGAIEAAGGIASSIIASKMGVPPEAMRQMLGGGAEQGAPSGPPIRRPPPQALPAPQQRRPPQAPPQRAPAQAAPPRVVPRPVPQPQQQPQQPQQQQPQAEPAATAPGLPQKQVKRVLDAAAAGEAPTVVARKLFALVETCDVNELHIGNPEAERIMAGLTNEAKVPEMLREFFAIAEVTDEEYLEAIRVVYIKLIYAYVEALQEEEAEAAAEGEEEAEAEGGEGEGEEGEEGEEAEPPTAEPTAEPTEEPAAEPPAEAPVAATPAAPEAAPAPAPEPVPAAAAPAPAPRGRPRRRIIPQPPQQETPPAAAEPAPETTT